MPIKISEMIFLNKDEIDWCDYIVVKALEDGVSIMGLTRGSNTRFHHTEKLNKGEVYIAQFTEFTSAVKINGNAEIYTKHGRVASGNESNA